MEFESAAVFTGGAVEESKTSDQRKAGTVECPYKLAVVGGGPSGCSIVIRAIRIGFESDLCGFCHREPEKGPDGKPINPPEYPTDVAGVCLIDAGSASRFGGGKLQDYVINANTWATKFVTNVVEEKPDVLPRETVIRTPLQRLGEAHNSVTLKSYGCKPAPLQMVGAFLREAGTIVQETLSMKYPTSSKVIMESSVTAIRRVQLPVAPGDPSAGSLPGWKLTVRTRKMNPPSTGTGALSPALSPKRPLPSVEYATQEFYAHRVALATGGLQALPRLPSATHNRKLISSDFAVTEAGVAEIKARLAKAASQGVTGRTAGRVVIVGGSHSSFSAAWICLHKLKDAIGNAPSSSGCNYASQETKVESAGSSSKGEEYLSFCQSGVCIVHKSNIKVFYCTKGDADKDGYNPDASVSLSGSFSKQGGGMAVGGPSTPAGQKGWVRGQIHPFGGLRGDAKDLWRSVKNGTEARVRLLQVRNNVTTLPASTASSATSAASSAPAPSVSGSLKQQSIVEKLFDEAVVIVWACGYSSNLQGVALEDEAGKPIALKYKCGQVEVDDSARVLAAEEPSQTRTKLAKHLVEAPPAEDNRVLALATQSDKAPPAVAFFSPPPSPPREPKTSGPVKLILISPAKADLLFEAEPTSPGVALGPTSSSSSAAAVSPPGTPGLPPPAASASPIAGPTASVPTVPPAPPSLPVVEGLMGSGLGFGLQAVTESGLPDGSSGRADGVAVYLKRGATLILSHVLGTKVFGGPGVHTWEDRSKLLKKMALVSASKEKAETSGKLKLEDEDDDAPPLRIPLPGGRSPQRRPNTTAGTSTRSRLGSSFGTSSTGRGVVAVVGKNPFAASLDSAQDGVLRRAMASRDKDRQQASLGKESSKVLTGSASTSGGNTDEALALDLRSPSTPAAFPAVHFPDGELGNQARPRTTATGGGRSDALLSASPLPSKPQDKAAAAAKSVVDIGDRAMRAAELVTKVALLSQDLESLQLSAAREFISMSPGKDADRNGTEAACEAGSVGAGWGGAVAGVEHIYPAAPAPEHAGSYSSPRKVKPVETAPGPSDGESPPSSRGAGSSDASAASILGGKMQQLLQSNQPLSHARPSGVLPMRSGSQRTPRPVGKTDTDRGEGKGASAGASVVLAPLELDSKHKVARGGVVHGDVTPRSTRASSGASSSSSSRRSSRTSPPAGPATRRSGVSDSGAGKGSNAHERQSKNSKSSLATSSRRSAAAAIAVAVGLATGERPPAGAAPLPAPLPAPTNLLISKTIKLELPSISRTAGQRFRNQNDVFEAIGANSRKGKIRPAQPSSAPTTSCTTASASTVPTGSQKLRDAYPRGVLRSSSGRRLLTAGGKHPVDKRSTQQHSSTIRPIA
jgi:hypothetical protein